MALANPAPPAEETQPTRWQSWLFAVKCKLLCLRRWLRDPHGRPAALPLAGESDGDRVLAESSSPLYSSSTAAEFALQAGKIQNLRVAARYLHGRSIQPGELFSFWAHVPRPTLRRGFAPGRELRAGCIIPSVGGGLCQLSNALYDAALQAGCQIVERHAHSRSVPGATGIPGRDATVFWNYVDLRFRAAVPCRLEVQLTRDELHVRLRGSRSGPSRSLPVLPAARAETAAAPVESCESCGVQSCFRHPSVGLFSQQSRTAWLLDAWTPEHDAYFAAHRQAGDSLHIPLPSRRWRIGSYNWTTEGMAAIHTAPHLAFRRSFYSRRLRAEGAARQRMLLRMDSELAEQYARRIPAKAVHVVVSQNLLPFLWRNGHLGGRTFDVLMTRFPMAELQRRLDRAAARWPGTPTLEDFRADPALVDAEREALEQARHWITPHTAIASLAGALAMHIPWNVPPVAPRSPGSGLVFPSSTLSRRGARELREALTDLALPLILAGPVREEPDFWQDVSVRPGGPDWLAEAAAVVLPAWIEHQPRRLLTALAAGIPVICTPSCGLPPQPGLTLVPEGDSEALREAIRSVAGAMLRSA